MLYSCLSSLQKMLSNYLRLSLSLSEDIVALLPLNSVVVSTPVNKLVISLVNIERETSGGLSFRSQAISRELYNMAMPSWQLNIYVLFSSIFTEKQYGDSLQVLQVTLQFLQQNKSYIVIDSNVQLAIEPVNISFSELSNLWSINGGTYYPSILCKIRIINIDSSEINKTSRPIMRKETSHE